MAIEWIIPIWIIRVKVIRAVISPVPRWADVLWRRTFSWGWVWRGTMAYKIFMYQRAPSSIRIGPPKGRSQISWAVRTVTRIIMTISWRVTRHGWAKHRINTWRPIIPILSLLVMMPSTCSFWRIFQSMLQSVPPWIRTCRPNFPESLICIFWDCRIYSRKFNWHFPLWFRRRVCFRNLPIFLFLIDIPIGKYCDPWWLVLVIGICNTSIKRLWWQKYLWINKSCQKQWLQLLGMAATMTTKQPSPPITWGNL